MLLFARIELVFPREKKRRRRIACLHNSAFSHNERPSLSPFNARMDGCGRTGRSGRGGGGECVKYAGRNQVLITSTRAPDFRMVFSTQRQKCRQSGLKKLHLSHSRVLTHQHLSRPQE